MIPRIIMRYNPADFADAFPRICRCAHASRAVVSSRCFCGREIFAPATPRISPRKFLSIYRKTP